MLYKIDLTELLGKDNKDMQKRYMVFFMVIVICFITACQPTPDTNAVVQRDNVEKIVLEKSKEDTPAPYEYKAPEKWVEKVTLKGQKKNVVFDADVVIPDTNMFPVAQAVPTTFTQEMADKIRTHFIGDQTLIEPKQITKADYDEMIVREKAGRYDGDEYYINQDAIDFLIQERENAPEFSEQKDITDFSIEGEGYDAVVKDNEECSIFVNETMIWYTDDYGWFSTLWDSDPSIGIYMSDVDVEIRISEDETIEIGNNTLESLGIEGLTVVDAEPLYFYDNDNQDVTKPNRTGYALQYMRGVQGLSPVYMSSGGMAAGQQFDYTPPMGREVLWMLIDDTREVRCFRWINPMCITDILLSNIELMPFDDVKQRLIDQLTYEKAFTDDEAYCFDLVVNEIRLAIDLIPVKDNNTACLYVPCWYLSYREYVKEGEGDPRWYPEGRPSSHIIINAIDGGSIATMSRKTLRILEE